MITQGFWTSKTFWTMVLGLAVFIANQHFGFEIPNEWIIAIMGILGIIFRWVADKPLSLKK